MAYYSPTAPPPPSGFPQAGIRSILLLVLDEELVSLLCSRIPQATHLSPISIRPDATTTREAASASPTGTQSTRTRRINASSSALSSPDYVSRLIRSANITTVLIDLRGHQNELGLSHAFLTALKRVGFAGHVIYVSVSGDLLKPGVESRSLRESYPVHAAVEVQLRNIANSNSRGGGFNWTVLGRSTQPFDSSTQSPISPQADSALPSEHPSRTWTEARDFGNRTTLSRSSSLSANASPRTPATELVEGVIQAIRTQGRLSNGRKIMLDLADRRRRSFMHQTDWRPD